MEIDNLFDNLYTPLFGDSFLQPVGGTSFQISQPTFSSVATSVAGGFTQEGLTEMGSMQESNVEKRGSQHSPVEAGLAEKSQVVEGSTEDEQAAVGEKEDSQVSLGLAEDARVERGVKEDVVAEGGHVNEGCPSPKRIKSTFPNDNSQLESVVVEAANDNLDLGLVEDAQQERAVAEGHGDEGFPSPKDNSQLDSGLLKDAQVERGEKEDGVVEDEHGDEGCPSPKRRKLTSADDVSEPQEVVVTQVADRG